MKKDENLYDDELDTSILENYYHQHKRKEKKGLCETIEDEKLITVIVPNTKIKLSILYSSKMTYQEFLDKNYLKIDINNISEYKDIVKENKQQILEKPNISYWQVSNNECYNKIKTIAKLAISGAVGAGSALAIMPIMNYNVKQLEEFDIDVHGKENFFIISTLNTLLLLTICNSLGTYKYITHRNAINAEPHIELDHEPTRSDVFKKFLYNLGGVASVIVTLQPLILLWDIERENKQVTNDNTTFDEFTAWATFTTIPLVVYKLLENYGNYTKTIDSYKTRDIEIDSFGAKAFINSTTALSLVGRGIALTHLYDSLLKQTGMNEEASLGLSIALGGVVTNFAQSTLEYGHVQSLFEKQIGHTSCKNKILGFFTSVEGGWFALPLIAQGLNAVGDLNSLLKMLVFLPTFISKMVYEMHNFYDTFQTFEKPNYIQQIDVINNFENQQKLLGEKSDFEINFNNEQYV
jgi:hypothetical protein